MSQKFSTFVNMINNKSNIEMQLATYKSMLTKASNDLAKSKQLVGLLKQQIEQGNTELSEELDKANERISMLSEDLSVVRSRESKEDKFKYNVEYIHAALSMEAKLCVMEYKEGSRSHSVQEDAIFKDSCIRVFTADRAVLYETIEKDLEEMGLVRTACWFHARHRFVDAYISDHRVRVIILMMNYLFQIERESKLRKHTAKQRRRFRLKYSASIVGKLMKLLKKIKLDSSYGAMVQRAVNYVLDDEKAFKVFLQDGRVEMHNNAVERMFRHLAMGRRNWMHTGSHLGAENIAFMFSLFESCKLNDINFGDYIEDILTRLMEGEQDFMSLIPCNYNSNKKVNVKAA